MIWIYSWYMFAIHNCGHFRVKLSIFFWYDISNSFTWPDEDVKHTIVILKWYFILGSNIYLLYFILFFLAFIQYLRCEKCIHAAPNNLRFVCQSNDILTKCGCKCDTRFMLLHNLKNPYFFKIWLCEVDITLVLKFGLSLQRF